MPRQNANISYGVHEAIQTRLSIGTAGDGLPASAIVYLDGDRGSGPYISFWHPEQMEALAADLIAHAARVSQQAEKAVA